MRRPSSYFNDATAFLASFDEENAVASFRRGDAHGCVASTIALAICYLDGVGGLNEADGVIVIDKARNAGADVVALFREIAKSNAFGTYFLARFHKRGLCRVDINEDKRLDLYESASQAGCIQARARAADLWGWRGETEKEESMLIDSARAGLWGTSFAPWVVRAGI